MRLVDISRPTALDGLSATPSIPKFVSVFRAVRASERFTAHARIRFNHGNIT
jgi:hypothetical protein